jgi:hypothetical protein
MANMLEKLSAHLDRRGFFGWAIKGAAALALALLGVPKAEAGPFCCFLINPSTPGCSGSTCWCWPCTDTNGAVYHCRECYTNNNNANCKKDALCNGRLGNFGSDCSGMGTPPCSEAKLITNPFC